jgi:hypothetical protein
MTEPPKDWPAFPPAELYEEVTEAGNGTVRLHRIRCENCGREPGPALRLLVTGGCSVCRNRLPVARYTHLRRHLAELGFGEEVRWSEEVRPPATAAALAIEHAWVVINSGLANRVAVQVWERVKRSLADGRPVEEAFGHRGKVAAIERVWYDCGTYFQQFLEAAAAGDAAVLAWCETLPWIGPVTRYHLAKNLGVDCAKPDRHLVRLAAESGETVDELCRRLATATGDRVATVDLVLWRAAEQGLV